MKLFKILVTGSAGFIGYHVVKRLILDGHEVVGLDNLNDYYDVKLKYARLSETGIYEKEIIWNQLIQSVHVNNYHFIRSRLEDQQNLIKLFKKEKFDIVINLAAQAGVRYSLTNPHEYIESNVLGFLNILECCRYFPVQHLIYASSSSVYGTNEKMPFALNHSTDRPISLYATTKKSNELMAHTYSHLFNIPTTGLRLFTVYGPWGRPDMAMFLFTKKILANEEIEVYNDGEMQRDFTYIDDIVECFQRLIIKIPGTLVPTSNLESNTPPIPYRILNVGNNSPVQLMHFVHAIEKAANKKAKVKFLPLQPGDVTVTWAECSELEKLIDYKPSKELEIGVQEFVEWYKRYYRTTSDQH